MGQCQTIHMKLALGIVGVDNVVMYLPALHIENIDENAADMPIVTQRQDNVDINLAMSNNFGFGGTNACLVMKKFNE